MQVAIAGGSHFPAPALDVNGGAVIRERTACPVNIGLAVNWFRIAAMRPNGRIAGPGQNRSGIAVGTVKRVGPIGRKTSGWIIVDRIIQVLLTIPGSFHDNHTFARRKLYCREIVGPPLDCYITELPAPRGTRSATMELDQDDVARTEHGSGLADGRG